MFLTQHIRYKDIEKEIWFSGGWAKKTNYNPRGIGTYGWGMLTGYTPEEADSIPRMTPAILSSYFSAVVSTARGYLVATPMDELEREAPGLDGTQTNWFWIRHPIFDMTRHVGEMLYIKGLWESKQGK